jgi:membrane protein implicated in regulation of membrane protease activity
LLRPVIVFLTLLLAALTLTALTLTAFSLAALALPTLLRLLLAARIVLTFLSLLALLGLLLLVRHRFSPLSAGNADRTARAAHCSRGTPGPFLG